MHIYEYMQVYMVMYESRRTRTYLIRMPPKLWPMKIIGGVFYESLIKKELRPVEMKQTCVCCLYSDSALMNVEALSGALDNEASMNQSAL